jgi:molecular chaperone Hsp33
MGLTEIKEKDDLITVQMNGRGPVGSLVSVIRFDENVSKIKAYISEPHIELPIREDGKIDVGGAIGSNGYLNIIRRNNITDSNY